MATLGVFSPDLIPQVILASDSEEATAKNMASHPKKKVAAPLKNQNPKQVEDAQSTWRVGDLQRFDMIWYDLIKCEAPVR